MSAHRALPRRNRTCPGAQVPSRKRTPGANTWHPPQLRCLREHAVGLTLVGLLVLITLPPVLATPSGKVELVATGALSLLGCVLVALICHEIQRR